MNDGNVAGNPVNQPNSSVPRYRSKFDLSYRLFNTERFGEYNVPFVMDCVEGDKIPLGSGGSVQSYTLKAPLMQSISKKKDFYQVPLMAILPLNWDKFYTNPIIGDDVPDDVGTGVVNFWDAVPRFLIRLLSRTYNILNTSTSTPVDIINALVRCLVTMEYIYSNGSLMRTLGCSGSRYFHCKFVNASSSEAWSFDRWFDKVFEVFTTICPYVTFTDGDGFVKYAIFQPSTNDGLRQDYACVNVHDFLQYFRDDLNCAVTGAPSSVTQSLLNTNLGPIINPSSTTYVKTMDWRLNVPYNLNRLWAYQLVCAHFYSNDHVDYVYSAELFRQLVGECIKSGANGISYFTANGLTYQYDYLSAKEFSNTIGWLNHDADSDSYLTATTGTHVYARGYLSLLFSYRRSLRFVDYFVGSRTRPLAVGDVNVDVQSGTPNYVSVIDVTRNIQRQRFFNAVNRFGRKIEEYAKGLTGVSMAPDYHNPLYIAHTNDFVYGQQVENTGADQLTKSQTVTSRLTSNGNRYRFEFSVDRPSVVIGISYYDINRAYAYNCERQLMHMNRFDMFNPFMQFIGDQPVNFAELGTSRILNYTGVFGYQLRHMEYKQRVSMLAGGFVENLPGYAFSDAESGRINGGSQSSDYIHSLNGELDSFYVSLTGFSLGSYFHFIVDNANTCPASRPMAYAPSIL